MYLKCTTAKVITYTIYTAARLFYVNTAKVVSVAAVSDF